MILIDSNCEMNEKNFLIESIVSIIFWIKYSFLHLHQLDLKIHLQKWQHRVIIIIIFGTTSNQFCFTLCSNKKNRTELATRDNKPNYRLDVVIFFQVMLSIFDSIWRPNMINIRFRVYIFFLWLCALMIVSFGICSVYHTEFFFRELTQTE